MSIKKVTLASLILLSLTACSGGGSSNSSTPSSETELLTRTKQELADKNNELEKLKKQLSDANAKVAEAKQNLEQLSNNKHTSAQLTQAKKELAEAQQAKKAAETNLAKIQAESTKELNVLQAKFDTLIQEKNNLSTQLANANAKVAEAQKNLEQISNDKQATEAELAKAKTDLQNAQQAKETAENKLAGKQRVIDAIHEQILKLDRKYYNIGLEDHHNLPEGFNKISYLHISPAVEDVGDGILIADRYIYKQPYSVVYSTQTKTSTLADDIWEGRFRVDHIFGEKTTNLPIEGNATYVGKAFNADNLGQLTYTVNFSERTGQGTLSGFDKWADIQLEKGFIENSGVKANASMQDGTTGKYELGFYGPNAEEIAGEAYMYKILDGAIKSNGGAAKKYNAPNRGTMFGFGGTKSNFSDFFGTPAEEISLPSYNIENPKNTFGAIRQ